MVIMVDKKTEKEEEIKVLQPKIPEEEETKLPDKTLEFPLATETIYSLTKGGFILAGKATLVSGTVDIEDSRIKASSVALVQYANIAGTLGVALEGECTDGKLTITSYDSSSLAETSDTSEVSYIIVLAARAE